MLTPRLAVPSNCFEGRLDRKLHEIAKCGAEGVRIDARNELRPTDLSGTGRRQFLHRLGEVDLRVSGLTFPIRRRLDDEDRLEARIDAIRAAMQFAFDLGGPVLGLRVGELPGADDPSRSTLVEVLGDLVRYGERVGTTLALAPLGTPPELLRQLLDDVVDGPIGVELDPAGCVFGRHDPVVFVRELYRDIVQVRLRDGIRDIDGSGLEVPLGRGDVDWTELLPTLQEIERPVWWLADRTAGDDRAGDVTRAVSYVRGMLLG